jgi:hypothetical protein
MYYFFFVCVLISIFENIFKDATLFFSRKTPSLASVIPAMDHIDKVLTSTSESPYQFSMAIRAALTIGKKVINKYYNKTDDSEVYRIVMGEQFFFLYHILGLIPDMKHLVLHPRHKLKYFKAQKWDEEWIQTARDIVRDEFERSYKSENISGDDNAIEVEVENMVCSFGLFQADH